MQGILIYGDSIFLAGLAEQLRARPDVQVEVCHSLAGLGDLAAFDAVIVDLDTPATADVLALLRARPDLRVIGVNASGGAVTVLSGQVYLAERLEDVIAHVENRGEADECQDLP